MSDVSGPVHPAGDDRKGAAGQGPGSSQGPNPLLEKLRATIEQQAPVLGERVNLRAQRARMRAAELRAQGKARPARLTEQAAHRAQQAGDWLRQLDADRVVQSPNRLIESMKARRARTTGRQG